MVHISEMSIKQRVIKPKYRNKMVHISEKSIHISEVHISGIGCTHRENQSAEAAAINTVCKPRRRLLCFGICANEPHKTFPKRTLLS